MSFVAAILGAPVMDPQGKSAAIRPAVLVPGRSVASIVDVSCQTEGYRSSSYSRGTRTVPGIASRPRSLRSRSTIMTFSARSFGDVISSSARA